MKFTLDLCLMILTKYNKLNNRMNAPHTKKYKNLYNSIPHIMYFNVFISIWSLS